MFDSIRQCFYEAVGGCDPENYGDTAMYVQAPSHDEDVRAATDIIRVLQESEKAGKDLENQVAIVMGGRKWTETLAKRVLEGLEKGLKAGMKMGESLKDAFDRAVAAAVDFAREHPVYTTIIAIGILVVLLPWVIEALGFAKLGPVEGKQTIPFLAWKLDG